MTIVVSVTEDPLRSTRTSPNYSKRKKVCEMLAPTFHIQRNESHITLK